MDIFSFIIATGLTIMDYSSLPHFCRREGSGSSRHSNAEVVDDRFSLDHSCHQQMYNYIKQQSLGPRLTMAMTQGSFHVHFSKPDPEGSKIAETIESEINMLEGQNSNCNPESLKINGE
ncbi:unnamed protein product [Victoria cruziana]